VSQDVLKGAGGVVETEFLSGRPASCVFRLVGSNGTELQASDTATVDPVNTTITVAATPAQVGAEQTVTVADATGIAADGRRYVLDGEDVTVKSVAGLVVTLWAPLMWNHAIGAAFQGVRVTATVDAVTCDEEFWDARGIFTPASGNHQTEAINCATDIIPLQLIGVQDIRDVNPNPQMSIAREMNLPRSIRVARDEAILMIGVHQRAAKHIGAAAFRRLAAFVWWTQRRPEYGENWGPELDKVEGRMAQYLALVLGQSPQASGDGTIPGPGGSIPANFNLSAWGA